MERDGPRCHDRDAGKTAADVVFPNQGRTTVAPNENLLAFGLSIPRGSENLRPIAAQGRPSSEQQEECRQVAEESFAHVHPVVLSSASGHNGHASSGAPATAPAAGAARARNRL
jgi:hypothetical protein